jgi:hypothetical protein
MEQVVNKENRKHSKLPNDFVISREPKPQIKHLQNLYSWSELYRSRGYSAEKEYKGVQEEITAHKKKYNLK